MKYSFHLHVFLNAQKLS